MGEVLDKCPGLMMVVVVVGGGGSGVFVGAAAAGVLDAQPQQQKR